MKARNRIGVGVTASIVLLLAAMLSAYGGAYFLLGKRVSADTRAESVTGIVFRHDWEATLFAPAMYVESLLTRQRLEPYWMEPPH